MHGSLDKQPQDDRSVYQSFSIKLIALPVLFIVALVGMAVSHLRTHPRGFRSTPDDPSVTALKTI